MSLFLLPTVCLSKPRTYVCFMNCFIDMFCPAQVIRHDNSKIFIIEYISKLSTRDLVPCGTFVFIMSDSHDLTFARIKFYLPAICP